MSILYNVILCGGIGTRLWPLSRKKKPKQFLNLFKNKSLLELTIERNINITNEFILINNKENNHICNKILNKYDNINYHIINETLSRNTTAAISFSCFFANFNDILIITPADHIINNMWLYNKAINKAIKIAESGNIVCIGIKPLYLETGFGYIKHNGYDVISFIEKPNKYDLVKLMNFSYDNLLWNTGIYCFKVSVFLGELKRIDPKLYNNILLAWQKRKDFDIDYKHSLNISPISVDNAIMEKTSILKVVPSNFLWNDLGNFYSLYEYLKKQGHYIDNYGNIVIGTNKFTKFIGVKNTIFVSTSDANLILNKDNAQDVKDFYSFLEKNYNKLI